jgi:phage terminase small subunit
MSARRRRRGAPKKPPNRTGGRNPERKLVGRQPRFVEEYLVDLNGTQAAIRAGYAPKRAADAARELLATPHVAEAIAKAMQARSARVLLEQDEVLTELKLFMRSSVKDYEVDATTGQVALAPGVPETAWRAVAAIKKRPRVHEGVVVGYDVEIRLWDKPAGVRMAGTHLGMFEERHRIIDEKGTGVLITPAAASPEEWARLAAQHQAALPGT